MTFTSSIYLHGVVLTDKDNNRKTFYTDKETDFLKVKTL